ncbi:hypothetical protein ACIQLJ_10030 [Microbacterium sp. NPDC091313]
MPPVSGAARRGLRAASAVLVAVVVVLLVLVPARLDAAVSAVAGGTLADARGEASVLRVSVRVRDVTDATDAAVRAALDATVGSRGAGVVYDVRRSQSTAPVQLADGTRTVILGSEALAEAEPAEGRWPARASEAAVSAELAETVRVRPGDAIVVRGRSLTVVGIAAAGATAAPWLRVPPSDGGDEPTGAVIVPDAAVADLVPEAWSRWTVVPDSARAAPAALAALPAAWRAVGPRLVSTDVTEAELSGGLVPTALSAASRAEAIAATAPVSIGVAALIGLVAALAFVQLLLAARAERRALLWARGAGVRRLTRDAVLDVAAPAVVGTVAGAVAGAVVLVVTGWALPAAAGWALAAPAAVCGLAAGAAVLDARGREDRVERGTAGRITAAAAIAAYAVLAALSSVQLLQYGAVGAGGGRRSVDAVVAAAPGLALTALAAVALVLLSLIARPVRAIARRRRRAGALLVATGVFGRGVLSIVPALLIAVALAHAVFAAGYAATWDRVSAADAAARAGAAVRVSDPAGVADAVLPAVLATTGVAGAAPAQTRSVSLVSGSATLLQLSAPALGALAAVDPAERAGIAAAMAPDTAPGLRVAESVGVTVSGSGAARVAAARAWFLDEYGCLGSVERPLTAGRADFSPPRGCSADAASDLVAVDLDAGSPLDAAAVLSIALRVDGGDARLAGWMAGDPDASGMPAGTPDALAIGIDAQRVRVSAPVSFPLPAVASRAFAEAAGVEEGAVVRVPLTAAVPASQIRIARVVDTVPGADDETAAVVDGRPLTVLALAAGQDPTRPSALWVGAAAPDAVAAALSTELPTTVGIDGVDVGSARTLLAAAPAVVGLGALASGVLALVGVAGVVGARRMRLAAESEALRAAGAADRAVVALAATEVLALGLTGVAVGLGSGLGGVALLAPALAAGAASGAVSAAADLALPAAGTLALAAAALAGIASVAAGRGARPRRRT